MDASRSNRSRLARLTPVLAVLTLLLLPAAARAQGTGFVERAVEALRSDPVYVDPAAESILSRADADALRERIPGLGAGDVYVAVLPREALDEVGGRITGLGDAIRTRLGRPGIHIVVAGNRLVAAGPEGSTVPQLATEAVQSGNDAASVLDNLFDRIAAAAADGELVRDAADEQPRAGGMGAGVLLAVMAVIGVGALLLFSRSNRRRKDQEQAELEEVRRTVLDDLVALGEALRAVDIDVRMPGADPRAVADYERGLALYQQASGELDRAQRPQDVAAVTAAIDEGRYLAESARARAEGREPPQRRPPCFFDPRHGPSVADREWAPPGGAPRAVPVCAADGQRIDDGVDPQPRRVGVRGEEVPYWDAPGYYAPWYGGYFGGGGGLLQGFVLGSLLSGGFGGWGHHHVGWGGGWGGGDGGAGSDFGGGDWGGGDFGGGGFGGGDFGGGGFGE